MTEEEMWEALNLIKGKVYIFIKKRSSDDGNNAPRIQKSRWRFIERYSHHAVFEDCFGFKRSFQPWEIMQLLKGESTGWPEMCQLRERVQ